MSLDDATPGWYGKLPTLGDFASRRLEADFIEPWDVWLGECMQAQRDAMGDAWLEAYLHSPPWRFLLMPGVLDGKEPQQMLGGVLMPSVDRVGRYFPLTIVASVAQPPRSAEQYEMLLAWLHRLEDIALDALQEDWSLDELEDALAPAVAPAAIDHIQDDPMAGVRAAMNEALQAGGGFIALDPLVSRADFARVLADVAAGAGQAAPAMLAGGSAIWFAESAAETYCLVSRGLPSADDFMRMFGIGGAPEQEIAAA